MYLKEPGFFTFCLEILESFIEIQILITDCLDHFNLSQCKQALDMSTLSAHRIELLSSFSNCAHTPKGRTQIDLHAC